MPTILSKSMDFSTSQAVTYTVKVRGNIWNMVQERDVVTKDYLLKLINGLSNREISNKNSSEDEIAKVNVLRRHLTCRGQNLRQLN